MKGKNYIQFIFVLAAFFVVFNAFAYTNKTNEERVLIDKVISFSFLSIKDINVEQEDIMSISKSTRNGLDVYTFIPKTESDSELLSILEYRLKTIVDGFVSLSVNDKNAVELVVDSAKITEERLDFSISAIIKVYGYYKGNYKIEEK